MKKNVKRFLGSALAAATAFASLATALPAHAILAGYTTYRTVYTYDVGAGTYTDRTLAAGNATANDVPLGGDQSGDTIYFGSDLKFENMVLAIGTGTAGGGTLRWEYSNDAAIFSPLPGVSQTWATAGSFPVNFSAPLDWTKRTINGTNRYWLRVSWLTPRAGGSVEPLLTQATTLLLNYRLAVHDEFGGGIAGLQDLNLFLSNCSDTSVYKVKDYGTGLYELALLISGADTTCDLHIEQTNYAPSATVSTGALSASVQQDSGTITMSYLVSASQSTASANPGTVPADNSTPSQITVTVKNWNNAPLAGRAVTLSSDHAGDTITGSPATTNASGVATFSVKSSSTGTAQYTATAAGLAIAQRASVTYTAPGPAPDAIAPTVGAISPTSVTAMLATTISATYSDNVGVSACDLILDGSNVGAMTLSAPGGMSGTASRSVTLSAGNHTARASCRDAAGNNGQGSNVTIVASDAPPGGGGAVSAARSWVDAAPASAAADGAAGATVIVQIADADGLVIAGATVTVSSSLAGSSFAPTVTATTNASGQAVFTIRSATAGTALISATANATLITDTATVVFTAPVAPPPPPADTAPSPATSLVDASPSSVAANGSSLSTITITVKNAGGVALSGKTVLLATSRPAADTIMIISGTTNTFGQATATVRSLSAGSSVFTATVEGIVISDTETIAFTTPGTPTPAPPPATGGRLIKLACPAGAAVTHPCKAVYYVGSDGKRHAFPNDKVYFTWYANFSGVEVVTQTEMSSHLLGKNVTYRPGVKMIKFATLANTYAVSRGGALRWITSEDVARSLYGTTWNRQVDDVSDAFFTNYSFGADIVSTAQFSPSGETAAATNIDLNF